MSLHSCLFSLLSFARNTRFGKPIYGHAVLKHFRNKNESILKNYDVYYGKWIMIFDYLDYHCPIEIRITSISPT